MYVTLIEFLQLFVKFSIQIANTLLFKIEIYCILFAPPSCSSEDHRCVSSLQNSVDGVSKFFTFANSDLRKKKLDRFRNKNNLLDSTTVFHFKTYFLSPLMVAFLLKKNPFKTIFIKTT
jgi:hypothetical protein